MNGSCPTRFGPPYQVLLGGWEASRRLQMKKPAALYARVSSDRQKENHTIVSQLATLMEYIPALAAEYGMGDRRG